MKIKHKVVKEFQYLSPDKKIFILKAGTILEEYNYKIKSDIIPIDKDIIDNNPEFFEIIDWKAELLTYIKANKLPTPAVLTKKLIPFIDEMVLSSIQQNIVTGTVVDESVVKELERKELDLNSREKRIKDKEEEIDIRLKRVEKRESEHKDDLKSLDKREDELRDKSKEVIEKGLDLNDKLQEINGKERNLDRASLESSKEIDEKYVKLQEKIDSDLKELSKREKELSKREESKSNKNDSLKEDIDSIDNIIEYAKNTIESMNNLDLIEGFISEPTKNHIKSKSDDLLLSLKEISKKLKKISK
jgi:DNA repair exonuclease SbcCD ATPase subunit